MFLEIGEEIWINTDNVFMIEGIGKTNGHGKDEYYIRVYSDAENYKDILMNSYEDTNKITEEQHESGK